jgi:hypothetical protein
MRIEIRENSQVELDFRGMVWSIRAGERRDLEIAAQRQSKNGVAIGFHVVAYTLNVGAVANWVMRSIVLMAFVSYVQGQLAHSPVDRDLGWRVRLLWFRLNRLIHYLVSTRDMLWELRTDCSQKLRQCGRVPRTTCSPVILPCNVKSSERLMYLSNSSLRAV